MKEACTSGFKISFSFPTL